MRPAITFADATIAPTSGSPACLLGCRSLCSADPEAAQSNTANLSTRLACTLITPGIYYIENKVAKPRWAWRRRGYKERSILGGGGGPASAEEALEVLRARLPSGGAYEEARAGVRETGDIAAAAEFE